MSRRSDSRHSSPLSVRSSAASVTEPSDRLLRSECRRQGGKHCGHVECQVRSSLSRRSGGHQHDHAAPSQTATPSSLSPTLSTVSSSITDAPAAVAAVGSVGNLRGYRNRRIVESAASGSMTTTSTRTTTTTTYTTRQVVRSGTSASGSVSNSGFVGLRSRLSFSNNNSNRSSQEEEDEELQEEDVDQQLVASESSSKIGSFRRMLSGGFSSLLWSSNSNNSNKRQTVEAEDERDIDEAQLSDADDLVMEKGSIEARLGTKDNLMPAFSDQLASAAAEDAAGGVAMETRARRQSLIRRATHPLLWLLGAIYYFAKLTLNRTANKLSNTAKHTVAIVTSGIALLLNSARAASCRLATGIGQVGGGIRRGFANAFAMTVGSVASMLRYANRATVVATASTKSIAGWVLQYSASAVRTLVLTTRERTYRSFVLISPSRNRRFSCLCFLVLLLLLLLIVIGILLWLVPTSSGYYSKLSPPVSRAAIRESVSSASKSVAKFSSQAWHVANSASNCLLLWLRDSFVAIATMAASLVPTWPATNLSTESKIPSSATPLPSPTPASETGAAASPGCCGGVDLSALELQVSGLRTAVADLQQQRLDAAAAAAATTSAAAVDVASAETVQTLANQLKQLELRFANTEASTEKLSASFKLAVEQSAAARSADSTEALSGSLSSKLASVTSQVDSIAQRLSRQSDETAATADAAAAASAAAVAAVNQSESARRLELASLRADLSRLANQHRRYFVTVWNRVQLLSESNAELFTRKDSDFKQQQQQQKQLADIEELRKSVLEFQTRLNRLESVQASISTGSSSMSGLLDSKSARCQSPADELADFALHTAGGYVVSIRCTKAYTVKRSYFHLFGVPVFSYSNGPNVALQPGLQLGECWPFLGFPGHVIVRLAAPARVSHVTIDHVPRSLTYNGSADSAPKNFSIYGLVNEQDSFQQAQLLGDFSYDADKGPSSQTFAIPADSPHRDRVYPAVELVIRSNHGAEHTCLYRFRVHGSLV
ncbi:hypothetical protein BOX15_Mlig001943g4 [Macrostomum lignano]|uniref:SUN domain-containing protein n=1 Tax=Macrostomum lignano TaxID=282301 RepID=A0A267EUR3_9PLAT|nr:hypothetical protein BOX15_Mlig001943g4 [Macrostomum lignano]